MQDEKGLHLTDVLSWAGFNPIKIGRKSNATVKGLQFQLGQYKVYIKQITQEKRKSNARTTLEDDIAIGLDEEEGEDETYDTLEEKYAD
jgi:hypothetical protein